MEDFLNGKSSRPAPQIEKVPTNDSPQPTIAEELKKYARMLKMKVPKPAILVQMRKDKIDESRIDEVPNIVFAFKITVVCFRSKHLYRESLLFKKKATRLKLRRQNYQKSSRNLQE